MFGNDYKKQCEELKSQLAACRAALDQIASHPGNLHIVKILIDDPDQFVLDGEYVVDESKAIYGAHAVSFSEAVMFKAGKESAKREFDAIHQKDLKDNEEISQQLIQLKSELDSERAYAEELRSLCKKIEEDSNNSLQQMSESAKVMESELRSTILMLERQLEDQTSRNSDLINQLEKWRNGEIIEETLPVETDFGIVEEVMKC